MDNFYVLFVKTGAELKVVKELNSWLDSSSFFPFVPQKEVLFRRNGRMKKEKEICFNGYVFINTDLESDVFITETESVFRRVDGVYRLLNYGERTEILMKENEYKPLMKLLGKDFCIEASVGFIVGDSVRIISGALEGLESSIKRINRHKREAILEVDFMGDVREVCVGLEIVERI